MELFTSFVVTVFGGAWKLFELNVPGFPFSYGDVIIACIFGSVIFGLASTFIGAGYGSSTSDGPGVVGIFMRGKSTRNPKISKERKNDSK